MIFGQIWKLLARMPLNMAKENNNAMSRYNLRSREKKFHIGDQVLILIPDTTTSKVFTRWQGPATVVEIKPHNSYLSS